MSTASYRSCASTGGMKSRRVTGGCVVGLRRPADVRQISVCVWDGLLSVTVGAVDTQYRRVGLVQSTRQSDHHSALIHVLSAYAGVVVAVVTATSRPPRVILSTVIPSVHSNGSDRTHRCRRTDILQRRTPSSSSHTAPPYTFQWAMSQHVSLSKNTSFRGGIWTPI